MHRFVTIAAAASLLLTVGCKKDESTNESAGGTSAKTNNKVDWETPDKKGEATPEEQDLAQAWPIEAPPGAEEFARGSKKKVGEIRQALLKYEGVFLNGWSEVLSREDAPAEEVQAALTELMSAVTGPGGLWTKIPDQWFGCGANQDSPPCQAFGKVKPHFAKWESFQTKLDTAPKSARFLTKSHGQIMKYLKAYVPEGRSLSSVQKTEFFKQNIAAAL